MKQALLLSVFFISSLSLSAQIPPPNFDELDRSSQPEASSFNYLSGSLSEEELIKEEDVLLKVSYSMVGHFSNVGFVEEADKPYLQAQEFIGVRIWPKRKDGVWVYTGWFSPDFTEEPLLQAVLHFEKGEGDTVHVNYYHLPEKEANLVHEWAQPQPYKKLKPRELFSPGCSDKFAANEQGEFQVCATDYCPTHADNGISYSEIVIHTSPKYINFFSRFYDADKKLILAYEKGNRFDRLPKETPKYKGLLRK